MKKAIKKFLIVLLTLVLLTALLIVGKHAYYQGGIPVLGYHGIVSDKLKKTKYANDIYYMSEKRFEAQLRYLVKHKYITLSMQEFNDYMNGKLKLAKDRKYVVLTFDDGLANYHQKVIPLLKKYHLKATSFVIGDRVGKTNHLKAEDLKNDKYSFYASHSFGMHHRYNRIPYNELKDSKSLRKDIQKNHLVNNDYLAYPYGFSTYKWEKVLKEEKVKLAFSYNQFYNCTPKMNHYRLPRYLMFANMPMWYFAWILS